MKEHFLHYLGLNENEAKVYMAVLEIGYGIVDEIAKMGDVSRPTAYKILRELVDRGLIAEVAGKPIKFRALPPQQTIGKIFQKKMDELNELTEKLPALMEEFMPQAEKLYKTNTEVLNGKKEITIIKGMKTYIDAIGNLENRVEKSVKIMGKSCPFTKEEIQQVGIECSEVIPANSVQTLFLLESKLIKNPAFMELVEYSQKIGLPHTYKHIANVPIEMAIYDDFAAIVELEEGKKEPLVLMIQNKQMLSSFIITFDSLWKKAKSISLENLS
ncbi:hypothetical protein DRQ33_06365 [bacterium]|nr:MAG: hypothetical protein DRQ33_06365 [bacterium]